MSLKESKVYLIPAVISEDAVHTIPAYVTEAVKSCRTFFVENERTARRFLKSLWKEIKIDDYKWFNIHEAETEIKNIFLSELRLGQTVGILSEAGCPGIADPGQILVYAAQEAGVVVIPLVGPNSILLALMASGMNGQHFRFCGYLPIDKNQRTIALKELEQESLKKKCTQIFIETPYRNDQLLESILATCHPRTKLCVAAEISSFKEYIKTKTISDWKRNIPTLHKKPVIFLIYAGDRET
jgi:16S rRNA (cytidine1402-2'-O)-methyltransferase